MNFSHSEVIPQLHKEQFYTRTYKGKPISQNEPYICPNSDWFPPAPRTGTFVKSPFRRYISATKHSSKPQSHHPPQHKRANAYLNFQFSLHMWPKPSWPGPDGIKNFNTGILLSREGISQYFLSRDLREFFLDFIFLHAVVNSDHFYQS